MPTLDIADINDGLLILRDRDRIHHTLDFFDSAVLATSPPNLNLFQAREWAVLTVGQHWQLRPPAGPYFHAFGLTEGVASVIAGMWFETELGCWVSTNNGAIIDQAPPTIGDEDTRTAYQWAAEIERQRAALRLSAPR